MRIRDVLFLVAFNCCFGIVYGQELQIGQTLPNLTSNKVYNFGGNVLDVDDLKGKAVIIDFWATWCGSCIESMPKMAKIQQEFGKDIQIVFVTTQKKSEVENFFRKRKGLAFPELLIITEDTQLVKKFPHTMIPHVIWISKDKQIKAITNTEEITFQNIKYLIEDRLPRLGVKKDIIDFDYNKSLILKEEFLSKVIFSSGIVEKIEGIASTLGIQEDEIGKRIYATNVSLLNLYVYAVRKKMYLSPIEYSYRVIAGSKRIDSLISTSSPIFYCYEAFLNKSAEQTDYPNKFFDLMRADLDARFGIKSEISKQVVTYFSLDTSNVANSNNEWGEKSDDIVQLNKNMWSLVTYLNKTLSFEFPFVLANTSFRDDQLITLRLRRKYLTISELSRDLSRFGISIQKISDHADVLLLKESTN